MPNNVKHRAARLARALYRGTIVVLLIFSMLLVTPAAMAQKKKDEEAEAPKSYVLPYFIVMMLVGVGLMTVCRPGTRKDQVDDKKRKQAEEL